jgi:hypothetical protein
MVDPKHPHAWVDIDHVSHPAIIIEWTPTKDVNGYAFWLATCLYWADGEPQAATVPARNVRKA